MAQPSKIGPVLLFLFGLPFLGFGLFAVFAFLSSSPAIHKSGDPIWGAMIASVFALIGAGLMVGAVYGYGQLKQEAAIKEANPDSPWLWRTDWAGRRALSRNRNAVFGWWIGAVLSSMIAAPILTSALPQYVRNSNPEALILIGFSLIPAILFVGAVRATIRRDRYGKTYFEFNSLPFSPGRQLNGQIHLRLNTTAEHGIDLRLSCIRRILTGSGNNDSTNEIVVWQDKKNVPQNALWAGPIGTAIPVDFAIPSDAFETNHDQPSDQVLWILHAQGNVPGVNYSDDFEIPVFRCAPNRAASKGNFAPSTASNSGPTVDSDSAATAPAFQSDSSEVAEPPNPKVVFSIAADGVTEFYFPAFRNRGRTFLLLLFAAIWTGGVYFLWHSSAPWFFAAVFAFFDVLLICGCVQAAIGTTRIRVGNGKIVSRREVLGMGTAQEILFTDLKSVLASVGLHQGTDAAHALYSVRAQTKGGRNVVLVDNIADRQEARWIAAQIEKFAGLQRDTHVVLEQFGRDYGPPPQRGSSPSTLSVPIRASRRPSPVSYVVAIVFFLAWTGYVFHRVLATRGTTSSQRAPSVLKAARLRQPKAARIVYTALADEDVKRLRALSPQAQAEELLDRAVQHDRRALELFEQNIWTPDWLGRIKLTDRMTQLERRSQFSTDLRVRYANADLNLSMDGWPKTVQSADQLIERARSDPHYRAAAVYFMGMLAGRGVAYHRIYPVLLDYAKHNPDETVRLWAVEGMRYLGTDEALDQLFDSFVSDRSNQVRDRAGCNVSDCGNFTRTQRMRMVPKLLSLSGDVRTTRQNRNWAFLALREITEENFPNDVSAWRNWYKQHGAEKLAEFESKDWWQVRGDE